MIRCRQIEHESTNDIAMCGKFTCEVGIAAPPMCRSDSFLQLSRLARCFGGQNMLCEQWRQSARLAANGNIS